MTAIAISTLEASVAALIQQQRATYEAQLRETMAVLAPRLGVVAEELGRPVKRLRMSGPIKTVGERGRMRYYPIASAVA